MKPPIIKPNPHPLFRPMYTNTGLIICMGGRGGMKSYETSKWAAVRLVSNFETRGVLIREEAVTIENSIMNEVKSRFETLNEKTNDYYSPVYEVQNGSIKNKLKKQDAVFTLGIRDSANYRQARLKSLSELDFSITEEAEDIRDDNKYFKLIDSIRHPEAVNIINLNVPDVKHWIIQRFFNLTATDIEGYYLPTPKEIEGVTIIQTSYKDNKYLPENLVKRYESYGDPSSPFFNPDYYYNQILGYCPTGRFGQVFKHIKPCKLEEYNDFQFEPFYGLDFGFTNDPTALVEVKAHNQKVYTRELIHSTGLTNGDIINEMLRLDIPDNVTIYCDSAEPKSIEELNRLAGQHGKSWKFVPATKGTDSVNAGIQFMQSLQIFALETSNNLHDEFQNYVFAKDRDGNTTNKPIDKWNHLIDALRYACFTHLFNQREELIIDSFF